MNYTQLVSGKNLFNNSANSALITDPVLFPNHPVGGAYTRTFFSQATLAELFRRTRIDIERRNVLNLSSLQTAAESAECTALTNRLRSYGSTGRLDGNFLQPGQTRCPVTGSTLQENDMRSAKLFRDVFIIAARNAIIQSPREFVLFTRREASNTTTITSEMKKGVAEILEALRQLTAENITATESALDAIIHRRNSGLTDGQVQLLHDMGINGRQNNINVRTTRRGADNTVIQSILAAEAEPNSLAVKTFANSLLRQKAMVNFNDSGMSSDRIRLANQFFSEVIQRTFAQKFREYGNDDAVCVEKIFIEIKALILEEIVKDCLQTERQDTRNARDPAQAETKKEEARVLRTWIEQNRKILLDTSHSNHSAKLTESLTHFNSKKDSRQIAWRTFIPNAPLNSWENLFLPPRTTDDVLIPNYGADGTAQRVVRNDARNKCRLRLAYYYLVATDNTQSPETLEARKSNYINCLAEIRRTNNYNHNTEDAPACYPGHLTRMALMGKDHPIAQLPMMASELLPLQFQSIVTVKIGEALNACQNYDQKVSLYRALTECSATLATDITMDAVKYSEGLLLIRERFVSSLGEFKELVDIINAGLARHSRNTNAAATPAAASEASLSDSVSSANHFVSTITLNETHMLKLMLLDVGAYALETITNAFKHSLTPEEIQRWDAEHPDATFAPSSTQNREEDTDPFPPLNEQQEINRLPKTMDEAQKIRVAQKKILINRISGVIYQFLSRANITQNKESIKELAIALGQEFATTSPTATDERRKITVGALQATQALSHLSLEQQQTIARTLIVEIDRQIFLSSGPTSTAVSAVALSAKASAALSARFTISAQMEESMRNGASRYLQTFKPTASIEEIATFQESWVSPMREDYAKQKALCIEKARTYATRIQALEPNSYNKYYDQYLAAYQHEQSQMEQVLAAQLDLVVRCKNYAQDVLQMFDPKDRTQATEDHHFFIHYQGTGVARLASEQVLEDTLRAQGLRRTARFAFSG